MTAYRLLLQGEGVDPRGNWFGFYAARDQVASADKEAADLAIQAVRLDWASGSSMDLGELRAIVVVACWRNRAEAPISAGHTFYRDDIEAQQAAWRIEATAAEAPESVKNLEP